MTCVPASCWIALNKSNPKWSKATPNGPPAGPPVRKRQISSSCSWLQASAAEPPASLPTPRTGCRPSWRGLSASGRGHALCRAGGTALCLPHGRARPGAKSPGCQRKFLAGFAPTLDREKSNCPGISGCKLLSDREKWSTGPGRPWTRHFISFGGGQRGLPGGSDHGLEMIF